VAHDRHADDDQHTETRATAASSSSSGNAIRTNAAPQELQQTESSSNKHGRREPSNDSLELVLSCVVLALTTAVAAVSLYYTPQADWNTVWN
jgi:hypothetical protein